MKYTIYTIRHISTDIVLYVGKTNDFQRRKREHLTLNSRAKEWLAVIGTDNVLIEPVTEFDTEEDALKYEDELILKYDTINRGYNKQRSGLVCAEDPKEYYREYYNTDKWKEYQRDYQKEYQQTEKYKKSRREYQHTDKYRAYQQDWHRDYRAAKKLGMSVAEYRQYIGE